MDILTDAERAYVSAQVLRFDPAIPIERATTPPASWYLSRALAHAEEAAVFAGSWQFATHAAALAEPGSFVASADAAAPWVVVRGSDRQLRAFHNVCRHKAAPVAQGAGTSEGFSCPYHGWRYGLDGRLTSAPRIAGMADFDRAALSLKPLAVAEWGPVVLINHNLAAAPPATLWPEVTQALAARDWTGLVHARSVRYDVACNWKVFCDNYLDGGYHIAHMHPSLADQLDLESYRTELFARASIQTSDAAAASAGARVGDGAIYAYVYPNLMLNRYGAALDTNVVIPRGPSRCTVLFDFWYDARVDATAIEQSVAQTDVTQQEDILVSEQVQRGLASPSYDRGRYAPRVEGGIHHFHRLLAADLRRWID